MNKLACLLSMILILGCDGSSGTQKPTSTPPPPPLIPTPEPGPDHRKLAVILVGLLDGSPKLDREKVELKIWTGDVSTVRKRSLYSQYLASSYGKLIIESDGNGDGKVDIYGPYILPEYGKDRCEFIDWGEQAFALAIAEDPTIEDYDNFMFILPYVDATEDTKRTNNGCKFGGMGFPNGKRTYINHESTSVIIHEFGHNLGLGHAGKDGSCVMGSSHSRTNAPHTIRAGWLVKPDYTTIAGPGIQTITLQGLNKPTGVRAIEILVPVGDPYYLSFHDDTGTDSWMRDDYKYGLNIHRANPEKPKGTKYITTIREGETFVDIENGLAIDKVVVNSWVKAVVTLTN